MRQCAEADVAQDRPLHFAFQAANGLISGVEAMLHRLVSRTNLFIEALNGAPALLPD